MSSPGGDAAAGTPVRITWTYALSNADLQRLLPRLLAPAVPTASGPDLLVDYPDGRRLRIEIGPERERHLGSIRLRDSSFTFVFEGWEETAMRAFLVHCTRGLQQGGG